MGAGGKAGEAGEYLSEYHGIMGRQRAITASERGYEIDTEGLTGPSKNLTPLMVPLMVPMLPHIRGYRPLSGSVG